MDPVWAAVADLWWIAPTAIGAGALGWLGLRGQRAVKARRLAYDASRAALRTARQDATAARIDARVARAELTRAHAERAAGRATSADVAAARRVLATAQRESRAARAVVRARRAGLSADRAALNARPSDPARLPLARLLAADDAVTARWLDYETDAAKAIAFPAMSDTRVPETAAFLTELRTTRALRPASAVARITPAQFGAYRDAVARLARTFDACEAEAWRRARAAGSAPAGGAPHAAHADTGEPITWIVSAQQFAQTVIARGAEVIAHATASAPGSPDQGSEHHEASRDTPPDPETPVWPVPSRGPRTPRS